MIIFYTPVEKNIADFGLSLTVCSTCSLDFMLLDFSIRCLTLLDCNLVTNSSIETAVCPLPLAKSFEKVRL